MIKIVCDRCGKDITKEDKLGYIAMNLRESGGGNDLTGENEFEESDFCMDCMKRIREFIKNADPESENVEEHIPDGKDNNVPTKERKENDVADINVGNMEKPKNEKKKRGLDKGKIMALKNAGWSNAKIAEEMNTTSATIATYISQMRKIKTE